MNLTEHFTFEELYASEIADRHNIDNTPTDRKVLDNLKTLALNLESVRRLLGKPIHINSAYRCLAVNALLGSKPTSAHIKGLAADIISPAFGSPIDIVRAIVSSSIQYDQVILEFDRWCHISFTEDDQKPRLQKLVIDKSGTRTFKG
ncbi:Peptidase M15A, C-terminal [uncultured Caudovirales phage]|uniref:Peptidase M15A, C-terminal n=1 Tax=uncultured Caudovirales phage TaxID=2100421 RepID=A0A6J5L3L9_9CAUD|nr:Peptidase M15A, C-terminal [uncultured Caudovirales phage]